MDTVISPVKKEERVKIGVRSGDTVRVHQKVIERGKTRIQTFEGVIIAVKHGKEAGGTFTVRATLSGIGVEKIFPLYSPLIDKIEIVRRSKVRRAKLYFIREKAAKAVRRQLRNAKLMNISTDDFATEEESEEPEETEGASEIETPADGGSVVEAQPTSESVSEKTPKDGEQNGADEAQKEKGEDAPETNGTEGAKKEAGQ
ncbi:MAG TPA: 50S ribosomal protein L19 [Candidatus Kaiserbacteria bacterium]|nr:50S ribosomal protein L19 [Candidatus Kaiserbacteria bacterium]